MDANSIQQMSTEYTGDRCPFVHGPHEAGTLAWKSSKTDSAVTGASSLENKTSALSDARSAPVEILPNPSEAASMRAAELQIKPKPYVHLSAHTNIDQNLVDHDRLQNYGFEEDPEYGLSVDGDRRGLNGHFSGYDYEDLVEDDPTYLEARLYYKPSDMIILINERFDSIREFHERSRERMLEPIFPRKRKSFPANLGADDQRVSRKKRSTEGKSNVFSGPKTLDEIKEEKRNAKENGNSSGRPGNSSRTTSEEFQGPKTLSEILKERNKLLEH
ncbi:hypothetical protein RHSIM_Rhsim03G0246700 [Rhododendron simsii]|uniref:Uncharacterized protein n=1 Tax=Rhododendron simsii TaxID=118357 RepID=A0A834LTM7_RHOSS|nr:hypothetical protein RHSIM_Rhsim03G0246700 [Rhododendron simsii]